jgi:hypothetical protein
LEINQFYFEKTGLQNQPRRKRIKCTRLEPARECQPADSCPQVVLAHVSFLDTQP